MNICIPFALQLAFSDGVFLATTAILLSIMGLKKVPQLDEKGI